MASLAGEKASPARREKFGKFVLLEQVDAANIGVEYRAAKLGSAGLEKIVDLVRLSPVLSANADAAKVLMDQAKFAAQLQNANVLKIFGIGKVEGSYYISYEFVEGKSLKTIFGRCRSEGFPFSVDHALLIASKICSALEYAHGRKLDGGGRYFHGLVTPGNVVVSYEGEVRLRGFGYWPSRVKDLGLVGDDEIVYVAPEQASGGAGEPRSDTFAVGAILFEALTGQPLLMADRKQDIALRIQNARLQGPSGDEDALPKQIADILTKALSADPGHRYAEIQEMRKGIDTLLFSGDFTPTTFNLAFFMHSLFREDIERESKVLKEEKEANYFEFLDDVKKTPLPSESQKFEPVKSPTPLTPAPVASASSLPLIPPPAPDQPIRTTPIPTTTPVPVAHREPAHAPAVAPPTPAGMTANEAAAGLTFHKTESKSKMPLFAGIGIVAVAAIAGVVMTMGGKSAPPAAVATPAPTQRTPSPEEIAAQQELQRVKDELAQMRADQEAVAKKAEDDARRRLQAEADKKQKMITAEELDRAAAAAAAKAQEEERRKQAQRAKELEDQQRAAEAEKARLEQEARERARVEQEKAAQAAAAGTAAPGAAAPAASAPSSASATSAPLQVGDEVDVNDAGVTAPVLIKKVTVVKPQRAAAAKVTGTVLVAVLVDENGKPSQTKLIQKIQHPLGQDCNTAALNAVGQMEWRPATKDGVRVKTWITAKIPF